MIYKNCSVNRIIADFYSSFKPSNSNFVQDAIDWIGDAIDIIRAGTSYGEQIKSIEVIDYRAKLPCDLESLLGISYKHQRLPRNGGLNHKDLKQSGIHSLTNCINESYTITPNYINTSFKDGRIFIYYLGLETDCDGYPTVTDDPIYREALGWYILMKMLGRGFKHQTFTYKDAEDRWNLMYPKARNRCRMPDIDGYQQFKKSWLGLVNSKDPIKTFFNSTEYRQIDNHAFPPNALVESYKPLGPNLNNHE